MRPLDRRTLLKGLGGAAVGLPLLEAMQPARAQTAPPLRLVVVYHAQGVLMDQWTPRRAADGSYSFGEVLDPLTPFKDDMVVLSGVSDQSTELDGVAAHDRAPAHLLTGGRMVGDTWRDAGARSLDQVIASRITPSDVPLPSLHLGVTKPWEFSFTGPRQPVDRRQHPLEVFEVLFGNFGVADDPEARARARRKLSVLDAVRGNAASLRRKLGASDREVLDGYLSRVEDIERRLAIRGPVSSCTPTRPSLERSPERDSGNPPRYDPIADFDVSSRSMCDLAVEALACDRTRVLTMAWGQPSYYHHLRLANGNRIRVDDWHLDVVHVGGGTVARPSSVREHLFQVQRWMHQELAYLFGRLKQVPEGDGNLLDHCLILYANELGDGATHSHYDKPYFLAGGANGRLRTGRFLEYGGVPHNRLLLSLLRAFGFDDPVFGERDLCRGGPLTDLIA